MKISCKLKGLRKEKKLTQEDLARELGISRQSIISVESGKSVPSLSLALHMAELFQSTIEDIFEFGEKIDKLSYSSLNGDEKATPAMQAERLRGVAGRELKMTRDLLPWRSYGAGRFFDEDWPEVEMPKTLSVSMPQVDVYEKGKEVIVEAILPGIDPENIKIDVSDNILKISGEKQESKEEKDKNFYRKEISFGAFARSISLPAKVKSEKAQADYSDGILKITFPKVEEKTPKTIKVKVKKK